MRWQAKRLIRTEPSVFLKESVKGSLRRLGWDVKRFNPVNSEWARLVQLLSTHQINVVLDIGANTGQFARNLLDSTLTAGLFPLNLCLSRTASWYDKQGTIHDGRSLPESL